MATTRTTNLLLIALCVLVAVSGIGTLFTARALAQVRADIGAQRETVTELGGDVAAMKSRMATQTDAEFISSEKTLNSCFADNSSATCTITNLTDKAIATCLQGQIVQKAASGVALKSLPICTGRLEPRATRSITAPWVGGFARDMCNSTDRFGNTVLDWEACSFTTLPVAAR